MTVSVKIVDGRLVMSTCTWLLVLLVANKVWPYLSQKLLRGVYNIISHRSNTKLQKLDIRIDIREKTASYFLS